jgi:hypothetical protein
MTWVTGGVVSALACSTNITVIERGDARGPDATVTGSTVIGPSGGTVTLGKASIQIPPGALTRSTTITITIRSDHPPSEYRTFSAFYEFSPEGLEFAVPPTVTLPEEGAPASASVFWSNPARTGYDERVTTIAHGLASAKVTHFSSGFVGELTSSSDGGTPGHDADAGAPDRAAPDAPFDAGSGDAQDGAADSTGPDSVVPDSTATDAGPDASCPSSDGGFVTLSSGGAPYGITVSPTHLFWADLSGKVLRMSLSDCSITELATGQSGTIGISLAGSNVYWTNNAGGGFSGSVVTAPQAGGSPTTLASGLTTPGDLTNDGTHLYWMPGSSGYLAVVSKMALGGGAVSSIGTGNYGISITTTGGLVYWTDYFAEAVLAVPSSGGTVMTLASGLMTPYGIATDDVNIYWTDNFGGDGGAVGRVPAAPDAGPATTLLGGLSNAYGVATDGTHVYFGTVSGRPSSIIKMNLDGSSVTTLVAGPTNATKMAVDSARVYWTDYGGGKVMMAPK